MVLNGPVQHLLAEADWDSWAMQLGNEHDARRRPCVVLSVGAPGGELPQVMRDDSEIMSRESGGVKGTTKNGGAQ